MKSHASNAGLPRSRVLSRLGLACAVFLALLAGLPAQGGHNHAPGEFVDHVHGAPRTEPYDPALVHAFRTLPVQDGGRIKPFESLAQVTLLRLNEKRSVSIPDEPMYGALAGDRLSAMEWALDVLLYPDQASDYPVFVVTDSEALRIIGLSDVAKRKRDRYSWNELAPGIDRLRPYYDEYRRIEEKDRSRLQTQVVQLGNDLAEYQGLQRVCDVARARFGVGDSKLLREAFGDVDGVRFSVAAAQADRLIAAFRALDASGAANGDAVQAAEYTALADFLGRQLRMAQGSSAVAWLPPADLETETWLDFSGVFDEIRADGAEAHAAQLAAIAKLESLIDATGNQGALSRAGQDFVAHVRQMADRRGEGDKIDLEVSYHEADYFYRALQIFVLGFLLCAFGWLRPQMKLLYLGGWATSVLAAGLVVAGLTVRCILLSRPPVSTLYETIVFITATAVLVALVAEAINKRRIALSLGAFVGALGMFVAGAFELLEQRDTLVELQAVLRTNFWLATHVTSVTIGYAGGLLAGFIAHIYLLGKLLG
ncbi:MAG: hypothetical protein ACO4CT_03120, partial [Planctomycetota bacterium]